MKKNIYALGPRGSNGEHVAKFWQETMFSVEETEITLVRSHSEIFAKVLTEENSLGVVPIENSTRGLVQDTAEFWLDVLVSNHRQAFVLDDVMLAADHNLLVKKGTRIDEITSIYSHQQALEQTSQLLATLHVPLKPTSSTSRAAQKVAQSSQKIAAVGSKRLASLYDLEILVPNIQNFSDNSTRFHLIGSTNVKTKNPHRASVIFTARNSSGSLVQALTSFMHHNVNMTSLHSIPLGNLGEFAFYCSLEANLPSSLLESIEKLHNNTLKCVVMGTY